MAYRRAAPHALCDLWWLKFCFVLSEVMILFNSSDSTRDLLFRVCEVLLNYLAGLYWEVREISEATLPYASAWCG